MPEVRRSNRDVDQRKLRVLHPDHDAGKGAGETIGEPLSAGSESAARAAAGRTPGLSLFSVAVESAGLGCRVTVRLRSEDALYEGVASGPDVPHHRLRIAAVAAVRAVEEFTAGVVPLALEDVREVPMGPRMVVLAGVALPGPDGGDCLLGAALLQQDPVEAAVRAVLEAVRPVLI